MTVQLWEILVPTINNEGKPFRTRHHKEWDKVVRNISGGMTILTPCKGQWIDKSTEVLYEERMIPVRIACTRNQIIQIMKFAKVHYKQIDILAYKVSDDVIFLSKEI